MIWLVASDGIHHSRSIWVNPTARRWDPSLVRSTAGSRTSACRCPACWDWRIRFRWIRFRPASSARRHVPASWDRHCRPVMTSSKLNHQMVRMQICRRLNVPRKRLSFRLCIRRRRNCPESAFRVRISWTCRDIPCWSKWARPLRTKRPVLDHLKFILSFNSGICCLLGKRTVT